MAFSALITNSDRAGIRFFFYGRSNIGVFFVRGAFASELLNMCKKYEGYLNLSAYDAVSKIVGFF